MDRVSQLRGAAGSSQDSTLDTTASPSEAYITANESSKYFSLSEVDSTFDISMKDESLANATVVSEATITDNEELISNLSPINKKSDILDSYKIGKQIEAANILSGGVDIFDNNENSYDGDELVIDDNVEMDDKDDKQGDEILEPVVVHEEDREVVLQINGTNLDAIYIGNGLYLYRKEEGQKELAAIQIKYNKSKQATFKFLKVRENPEGNLDVYEEFQVQVPKEVPANQIDKASSSTEPVKEIDAACNKDVDEEIEPESSKEDSPDNRTDPNGNAKAKFSESRKSPVIGSFTPMTYHSTPNKEGKPLTKTMVDQKLHPNRHSDIVKKTIEVHTDDINQKPTDTIKIYGSDNKVEDKKVTFEDKLVIAGKVCVEATDVKEAKNINKVVEEEPSDDKNDKDFKVAQHTTSTPLAENNEFISADDASEDEGLKIVENPPDLKDSEKDKTSADNVPEKNVTKTQYKENLITVKSNDVKDSNDTVEICKGEVISTMIELDEKVSKSTEQSAEIETAVISLAENNSNENSDTKTVEINLDDKDDAKIEEGILIIDEDNSEGTVLTIDDIINDTESINKKASPVNSNQSNCQTTESKIHTPSSEKPGLTVHAAVNIKNETINALTGLTSENIVNKATVSVEKEIHMLSENITNQNDKISSQNISAIQQSTKDDVKVADSQPKICETTGDKKVPQDIPLEVANVPVENQITLPHQASSLKYSDDNMTQIVNEKNSTHNPNVITEIPAVAKEKGQSQPQTKPNATAENTISILYSPVKKESKILTLAKSEAIVTDINTCLSKHEQTDIKNVQIDSNKEKQPVIKEIAIDQIKESKEIDVKMDLKVENFHASIKPEASKNADPKNQTIISKPESKDKMICKTTDHNSINNIHSAAVPFGQWTEANRQEFLNKFKSKVPVTTSSSSQLKNSNDLNRRDVLKKIDSQRQTSNALSKTQEAKTIKNETVFSCKANKEASPESKITAKPEISQVTPNPISKPTDFEVVTKTEVVVKSRSDPVTAPINITKKESAKRTEVTVTDLISKTVEDMMHKVTVPLKASQDEPKNNALKETKVLQNAKYLQYDPASTLDAIEMKMNELHGIPFIERPPHELPKLAKNEVKGIIKSEKEKPSKPLDLVSSKTTKIPNLLPFPNKIQQKNVKDRVNEVDSEEEIIEHQPITGDIELNKKNLTSKTLAAVEKPPDTNKKVTETTKSQVIITEKDFDKFARRNSITYENCLTVNFDGKEPHNVVKTVVERDAVPKTYSKNDILRAETKPKLGYTKQQNVYQYSQQPKIQKYGSKNEDGINRNQSKLQKAYQSVLTAKRQKESPITIIEDKPVKVVFMDNLEFVPRQLNVQGKELSPVKKSIPDSEITVSTCDSVDSDTMDDIKLQDELKAKTKHQRKQVLTPVEEPELELIEPKDLGLESSPKKKRKTNDDKSDKNIKYPVRKKFFQYNVPDEKKTGVDVTRNSEKETMNRRDNMTVHNDPVSAIDSLVKAAELLETQTEELDKSCTSSHSDSQQSTPVKRGRGRPRKYPLPEGANDKKAPSPQKKPRLIDAKPQKRDTTTDEDDSDDELIKENWTMGKINENIVCPICNKLFRTENVVFKHVKHCTGPSPNRSDSDKRSPRRSRQSQESESKSADSKSDDLDFDDDEPLIKRATPKKLKPNESATKIENKEDVIVIEDTPDKNKTEKIQERKLDKSLKLKAKPQIKHNDLVCEFCGKVFRQLSYLANHKLQHKKEDSKKADKDNQDTNKSIYSCEVCKKEFRKLHHLVQHRIIHNPVSMPTRSQRKSSLEIAENNTDKLRNTSKNSEDPSAGFRCEPCDKSFRKLHHLVEHRETHDGINSKQKVTVQVKPDDEKSDKALSTYQCDFCKKSFRKLHHLIEHKDIHLETCSEKSDDKSVKSISTKDIIHECSLCYMVFPNEHSLTKHTVICQRKKKQPKAAKQVEGVETAEENNESSKTGEKLEDSLTSAAKDAVNKIQIRDDKAVDKNPLLKDKKQEALKHKPDYTENNELINQQENVEVIKNRNEKIYNVEENAKTEKISEATEDPNLENIRKETPKQLEGEKNENKKLENTLKEIEVVRKIDKKLTIVDTQTQPTKREFKDRESQKTKSLNALSEVPEKIKKIDVSEVIEIQDTPNKKSLLKDKVAAKRVKTAVSTNVANDKEVKPPAESSDDDEIRYMFNPNFKAENVTEEKVFMKVRANKRSSLQIERPNSKDLMKRRTSLQHPPKIPRLKPKTDTNVIQKEPKTPKQEPVPSIDSDDSETTKYSFPITVVEKLKTPLDKVQKDEKKVQNKLIAEKRKSLSAIAKRKSLGKSLTVRHKPSPLKQVKKRTLGVEHRCDCGQLFSSAALLTRHTTLAHTPPRIRRRRSPLPEQTLAVKATSRKSNTTDKPKQTPASRKSSVRSDSVASNNPKSEVKSGRKLVNKDTKTPADRKAKLEDKSEAKSSVKPRRTGAHRGVPVPEKMKKLMQKNK